MPLQLGEKDSEVLEALCKTIAVASMYRLASEYPGTAVT